MTALSSLLSRHPPASRLPCHRSLSLCGALIVSGLLLTGCGGGSGGAASGSPEAPGIAAPGVPASTSQAVATAVGAPTGAAASATIGAAGGRLAALDGKMAVLIPADALAADTVIGIQPITNMAHGNKGAAYRLTPDGQTFLKPVTLTFAYTDQDLVGTAADLLGAAFQTREGFWQWVGEPVVDPTGKTVSVGLTHFTDTSLVGGLQIRPPKKVVKPGESVVLEVMDCYRDVVPGSGGELVSLGVTCNSELAPIARADRAVEWSVNGQRGGGTGAGGVFGKVSGNFSVGTYTAPATAPTPPTVAVSARLQGGPLDRRQVVSNITIAQDSWTGTSSTEMPTAIGAVTIKSELTWTLESTANNIVTYAPSGTASVSGALELSQDGVQCTLDPKSGTIDPPSGFLIIDFNANPPTYRGQGLTEWPTTHTCVAPGIAPVVTQTTVAALYLGDTPEAQGVVSADGTTIEGSGKISSATVNWKFTRN